MKLMGPGDGKAAWERFAIKEMLFLPLIHSITEAAIAKAVDFGSVEHPWHLPDSSKELLIREIVYKSCDKKLRFISRTPLKHFKMDSGSRYRLSNNIELRHYTKRDIAIHLTRDYYFYNNPDILEWAPGDVAVLEVFHELDVTALNPPLVNLSPTEHIERKISQVIDTVKWAISSVNESGLAPIELSTTYANLMGGNVLKAGYPSFRRQFIQHQGNIFEMNDEVAQQVAKLTSLATNKISVSKDLNTALWYWARASIANSSGDRIRESAVGLESLVVMDQVNLGYKFRLHAAALLSTSGEEAKAIFKDLKDLYSVRGKIVHGKEKQAYARSREEFRQSILAFKYLRKAIYNTICLMELGRLQINRSVASQIEEHILFNSFMGTNAH